MRIVVILTEADRTLLEDAIARWDVATVTDILQRSSHEAGCPAGRPKSWDEEYDLPAIPVMAVDQDRPKNRQERRQQKKKDTPLA